MTLSSTRLAALILLTGFAASFFWFFPTYSADLMATWLAGVFLKAGQPDQVYPAFTEFFLMYPPSEWRTFMSDTYGYSGPVYPFLYPPLWAKLSQLVADINFWRITAVALAINAALQMLTVWLAWRAVRTQMNAALFVVIAVVFLLGTHIGTISLQQNQPQIFVSFLLVLAIERNRFRSSAVAGIALALAASIKLYPALFALFWLFGGERKAFLSFLVFGVALAAISVIWAGWPLHQLFLEQISLISDTVLVTAISFSYDAAIAQLFYGDSLIHVPGLEPPTPSVPEPGWYAMPRPETWRYLSSFVLLSAIGTFSYAFSRASRDVQTAILWPMALTVVALLSPISWAYYYLPTACFAPVLIAKLGQRLGAAILLLSFAPIFWPFVRFYRLTEDWPDWPPYLYQIASVAAFTILTIGFAIALKREWQIRQSGAAPSQTLASD